MNRNYMKGKNIISLRDYLSSQNVPDTEFAYRFWMDHLYYLGWIDREEYIGEML